MKQAFTLIELAIVIIIIGLLVGGVLTGQELIKQAEIRGVVKDFQSINSAVIQYNDKYNAYPGDDATALAKFPNCTDIGPCLNGNGNKEIGATETPFTHMLATKYLKGGLCAPIAGLGGTLVSAVKGGCYGMWKPTSATVALFGQVGFTWLNVVSASGTTGAMSASEVQQVDIKLDDDNPSLGKFLGINIGNKNCTLPNDYTTTPAGGAVYDLSSDVKGCRPYLRIDMP